jgi:hypothetical protein
MSTNPNNLSIDASETISPITKLALMGAATGLLLSRLAFGFHLYPTILFTLGLGALALALLIGHNPSAVKRFTSMGVLMVTLTLFAIYQYQQDSFDDIQPIAFILTLLIFTIATAFIQSWSSNKPHFTYTELFKNAWNNPIHITLALLLIGATFAILGLASLLFMSLGLDFFSTILFNSLITPIIIGIIMGIAIGISYQYQELIFKFKHLLFSLFKVLAYIMAFITILFTLSLPFTLEKLFEGNYTSVILLSLTLIGVILLNSQVDSNHNPTSKQAADSNKFANYFLTAQILLNSVLILLSLYAIYLRIDQYGLTPVRWFSLVAAFFAFILTASYAALTVKYKFNWRKAVIKANPPVALFGLALGIVLLSPLLSPTRLSTNNQVERLLSGQISPEQFDYSLLKDHLGKDGQQALTRLENNKSHPLYAQIKVGIDKTEEKPISPPDPELVIVQNADLPPEPELSQLVATMKNNCHPQSHCLLTMADITKTGKKDILLFNVDKTSHPSYPIILKAYRKQDKDWQEFARLTPTAAIDLPETLKNNSPEFYVNAIKAGQINIIEPAVYDVNIGGLDLRLSRY